MKLTNRKMDMQYDEPADYVYNACQYLPCIRIEYRRYALEWTTHANIRIGKDSICANERDYSGRAARESIRQHVRPNPVASGSDRSEVSGARERRLALIILLPRDSGHIHRDRGIKRLRGCRCARAVF
jgi:hypothetical protein